MADGEVEVEEQKQVIEGKIGNELEGGYRVTNKPV